MAEYTKLTKHQLPVTKVWVVESENTVLSCVCHDEAEADFVMGALNACISIAGKDRDPLAVADGIEEVFLQARNLHFNILENWDSVPAQIREGNKTLALALASIERGK